MVLAFLGSSLSELAADVVVTTTRLSASALQAHREHFPAMLDGDVFRVDWGITIRAWPHYPNPPEAIGLELWTEEAAEALDDVSGSGGNRIPARILRSASSDRMALLPPR